jgi:hypothetical protein
VDFADIPISGWQAEWVPDLYRYGTAVRHMLSMSQRGSVVGTSSLIPWSTQLTAPEPPDPGP